MASPGVAAPYGPRLRSRARAALEEWSGYAPTAEQKRDLDGELDRRMAQAGGR
ncbi:hypothetical protein [Streptomyces niveus]|uniref:hypothetical protein n=1 Tax=Streptomyces niveus TaxID=193462 RepID=UPI0035E07FB1